jgi:hypothetical protein
MFSCRCLASKRKESRVRRSSDDLAPSASEKCGRAPSVAYESTHAAGANVIFVARKLIKVRKFLQKGSISLYIYIKSLMRVSNVRVSGGIFLTMSVEMGLKGTKSE